MIFREVVIGKEFWGRSWGIGDEAAIVGSGEE